MYAGSIGISGTGCDLLKRDQLQQFQGDARGFTPEEALIRVSWEIMKDVIELQTEMP